MTFYLQNTLNEFEDVIIVVYKQDSHALSSRDSTVKTLLIIAY
jgi:hypothetical protein